MLFNSLEFLVFLPLVLLIYWLVFKEQRNKQNVILLISSYVFYSWWDWRFLGLIVLSTVVDFVLGNMIYLESKESKKKVYLYISLVVNLGTLAYFKYANFFLENAFDLICLFGGDRVHSTLNIILPVGISFYTFQTLSYTIDIYHGRLKPTKDIIAFGAFISFFPQLVAGPIERATNLLPQFLRQRKPTDINAAFWLIFTGLVRKTVFADNLGHYVDMAWDNQDTMNIASGIIASLAFSVQIWFDFSGYSRIARGVANLFGFNLMLNFSYPYSAVSLREFWSRWHISLSTWFRDYVYIPLGGNRLSELRTNMNLMLVFIISGFWHGSGWNFIFWGFIHGTFIIFERLTGRSLGRILTILVVTISWIPFRSPNLLALKVFLHGFLEYPSSIFDIHLGLGPVLLSFYCMLMLILPAYLYMERRNSTILYLVGVPVLFYFAGAQQSFIYFQF